MKIPYVIDNQDHILSKVLSGLLEEYKGQSLDVATAYFTVGGFGLIESGLNALGSFRLLLGAEPTSGEQVGLKPGPDNVQGLIKKDLEILPFDEKTLQLIEDLISYLQKQKVEVKIYDKGFLHAKCWLFYSDRPGQQMLFERFRPVVAIVGSSNFTTPGLTSNRELNLSHKVLLDPSEANDIHAQQAVSWLSDEKPSPQIKDTNRQLIKSEVGARAIIDLEQWFQRQWDDSVDFKDQLIQLLDDSKFGRTEYTPYQVYMKALYEYFQGDFAPEETTSTRSAVELAEFQEDAVKKARKILLRYDGVMIADSVGLGKTWIGKKLLEDFAYHLRQKALVICPAALREMWERELGHASISGKILSQEALGRDEFDPEPFGDVDVVLIDESHNFRNRGSNRYLNLELVLGANGGRGREGASKKIILLTATPINNDLFDLYNQLSLITRGDQSYFSAAGIGDLRRYFLQVRRDSRLGNSAIALFNLLEEIVVRRTRPFIRSAYPDATINGKKIHFPERRLRTIQYNLEATYAGIYEDVFVGIDNLRFAQYNLENYKKEGIEIDDFEVGREQALVGIFKSRYLKRFESSIEAFRISIRRALAFLKTFESYVLDGKLLRSSEFHKALRYIEQEDEEDDAVPTSLADELDASKEAQNILEEMETIDPALYDLRKLHDALQQDRDTLTNIWQRIKDIKPENDVKLNCLKEHLQGELQGKKILIFSYYKDTVRYLYKNLGDDKNPLAEEFKKQLGNVSIRRMDSGAHPKEKEKLVHGFAPKANEKEDWIGTDKEIDILISSDVLSEGQNLQDCGYLINYDLHWNPTRMVQRAGRIDRLGTEFDTLSIFNMFPDEGLERLLGLVESLTTKISSIDQAGFLDASVLGETINPRNFNTLRRIRDEDGSVIEEEEQFTELASNEFLKQQLQGLLDAGGKDMLESLPDGIHSGLIQPGSRGVFFYFQATSQQNEVYHFWKYFDLKENRIIDNRYVIANLITCDKETPRIVDQEIFRSIFDLQEKVIDDILSSYQQQQSLEAVPRTVGPIQQTIATTLQGYINHPDVDRTQCIDLIKFLNQPMLHVQIKELRDFYKEFQSKGIVKILVESLNKLKHTFGSTPSGKESPAPLAQPTLNRKNLKLICFDIIS